MAQSSLIFLLAVAGSIGFTAALPAYAQATTPSETPPAAGPSTPSGAASPTPSTPASQPATGAAPTEGPTPATSAAPPANTPSANAASGAPEEGDDMSMTFHSSRTADMQQFAEGSLQELHVGRAKPRFAMNLFGDLSLGAASKNEGATQKDPAFAVGVFDMLFNGDLDGKILATAEITFQYEPSTPLAELERLHVRWKPNKAFFLEVGRFHTDIGYWNVAYHHGKWLQLSIERPRTILLHGGLLPVHWIGAQSGVTASVGKGNISLVGSVGSSRDPIPNTGSSHNSHGTSFSPVNGAHAKLEAAGFLHSDLRLGVSGIYSRISGEIAATRPALPDQGIDEYIGNAYIAFPSVPFTFIAEGYVIEHRIPSADIASGQAGAKWRTYAAFAMIGYQIGRVTPYIKGEYVKSKRNTDLADPFYIPQPKSGNPPDVTLDLVEGTIGARIDTSTWSALKLEYRATGGTGARLEFDQLGNKLGTPLIHTVTANWSFGI